MRNGIVLAAVGLIFVAGLLWSARADPLKPADLAADVSPAAHERAALEKVAREGRCGGVPTIEPEPTEARIEELPMVSTPELEPAFDAAPEIPLSTWVADDAIADVLAMVSPQGLFDRTSDWWAQDEFLALTGDELALLVPDAEGYAFGGDGTLLDFLGGLPTVEDCERGFADPAVQRELARVVALELPINALGMTPMNERSPEWQAGFDRMLDAYRASEADLARELDRASGYVHWSILRRAFAAWNQ